MKNNILYIVRKKFHIHFQVGKNYYFLIPKKVIDSLCQGVYKNESSILKILILDLSLPYNTLRSCFYPRSPEVEPWVFRWTFSSYPSPSPPPHHQLWGLGGTVLNCTVYCTVLYCTVLYCTVLYCTVLYCTVLYCTVLYCTVLYCTVLYCTVLYCTVLYCTALYCKKKKKKKNPPP